MKISKLNESINESVMESIKKYSNLVEDWDDEKEEKEIFSIYYYDQSNERKDFRQMSSVNSLKKFISNMISNPSKLNSLGATGLFVDDSSERNVFSAFKDDDGSWKVEEDNLDDLWQNVYLDPEYRDTQLNRLIYSITSTSPANLKHYNGSLANGLYKVNPSLKITNDIWGYHFNDNGDAIVNITINKNQLGSNSQTLLKDKNDKVIQDKKDMLADVCKHFGLQLIPFGERAFSIIVPNQAKYYEEY